jgi:glycosyltransferase involved in cell wall biosynthesis
MKILQINNVHYRRGGADVVYLNTGKLLEDHDHEVFYFSQKNKKNVNSTTSNYFIKETNYFEKSLLGKIFSISRFFFSSESKRKISRLIQDSKPDIAHVHLYKADITPSIFPVLKNHKIPVIITVHDYGLMCPHNLMLDGKMNICTRCVKGSAFNCIKYKCNRNSLILSSLSASEYIFNSLFFPFNKYFSKIITVSKFGQELHKSSGKFNIEILHLYNFFPDIDKTNPVLNKGSYFLFFGRLSKEKGISTLIQAWHSNKRHSRLKIAGTGDLYDQLTTGNLSNNSIDILGFKEGSELDNLVRNCSFVIVPSEWYENNPLTIIEAYANGKPVIGANVGGIPEIIENGKTGFIFTMRDVQDLSAKIELAENISADEYKKMAGNARSFAEAYFSEKKHYEKLMAIYNSVLI